MAPSSCSSSSGASHAGLALAATAMALSGTLVLYSLCRARQPQLVPAAASDAPSPRLRPCLSSSEKRRKRGKARRGGQKRVRFADDVVDNGAGAAAARERERERERAEPSCAAALRTAAPMPPNREALYRGMLRGRSMLRLACSY